VRWAGSAVRAAAVAATDSPGSRDLRPLDAFVVFAVFVVCVASGCVDSERFAEPPGVDRARFEAEVYPILLRDCGFPACHGDSDRFFRVHGPGRTRLDPETLPYDAPTAAEIDATFDRTRSMLAAVPDPRESLLLRKPLEASAGGGAHMGLDALGRNVYASREDPSWQAIAAWAGAEVTRADAGAPDATLDAGGGPDTGDAAARDGGDAASSRDAARDTREDAP
jgi:hypothetical protein